MEKLKRGDMYFVDLNPVVGSEQGEKRPAIVVQNDIGNKHSPTVVIVPLTCNLEKKPLPTHVFIPQSCGLESESLALVEQIRTVDRSRLKEYIGRIKRKQQAELDKALIVCVGLDMSFLTQTTHKNRQRKGGIYEQHIY